MSNENQRLPSHTLVAASLARAIVSADGPRSSSGKAAWRAVRRIREWEYMLTGHTEEVSVPYPPPGRHRREHLPTATHQALAADVRGALFTTRYMRERETRARGKTHIISRFWRSLDETLDRLRFKAAFTAAYEHGSHLAHLWYCEGARNQDVANDNGGWRVGTGSPT